MVFRDALTAGLAASGDLFPAPILKALLFFGVLLVQLGLGASLCQGKREGSATGTYRLRNADGSLQLPVRS